jgi:hypothetical protein
VALIQQQLPFGPFVYQNATYGILDDDEKTAKTEYIITTQTSILILSCAAYRLRNTHHFALNDTDLISLSKILIEEDTLLAKEILDHFRNKLIWFKLKEGNFSKFKTDLSMFLNSPELLHKLPKSMAGMVYRLPYFYDYDMKLKEIFGGEYKDITGSESKTSADLTFIDCLYSHKRDARTEFWFVDEYDNRVVLTVDKNNPLKHLLLHTVQSKKYNFKGLFRKIDRYSHSYFSLEKWNITF